MSDLFGSLCKHCKDPEATHVREGLRPERRYCFIGGCGCPGYERDNLRWLEEKQLDTEIQ